MHACRDGCLVSASIFVYAIFWQIVTQYIRISQVWLNSLTKSIQRILLSLPPQALERYLHIYLPPECQAYKLKSSCFCSRHFTNWAFPSSLILFEVKELLLKTKSKWHSKANVSCLRSMLACAPPQRKQQLTIGRESPGVCFWMYQAHPCSDSYCLDSSGYKLFLHNITCNEASLTWAGTVRLYVSI